MQIFRKWRSRTKSDTHRANPKSTFFVFSLVVFVVGVTIFVAFMGVRVTRAIGTVFISASGEERGFSQTFSDIVQKPDVTILRGYDSGRINILLLGIAGKDTEKRGELLTDTIMIASIDVESNRVALMSLPRDLLVESETGINKINAFYGMGVEEGEGADRIIDAVEEVTDIDIHYNLVMDFAGFIEIVDALGGINITVPATIDDPLYPGPGYSYEPFFIRKGFHTLDGTTALKYVRTRHDDPESDFGRAKRQQTMLRAIRNKALSLGTLTNPFTLLELLEILGDHIATNIQTHELRALSEITKTLDTQNITTVVVDAWKPDSLLNSIHKVTPVGNIAGLTPRSGDWDEIHEYADAIFHLEQITLRRDAIVAEAPTVYLIDTLSKSAVAPRVKSLLTGLGFPDVQVIRRPQITTPSATAIIDYTDDKATFSLDAIYRQIASKTILSTDEALQNVVTSLSKKVSPRDQEEDDTGAEDAQEDDTAVDSEEAVTQEKREIEQKPRIIAPEIFIILGDDIQAQYDYAEAQRDDVEKEYGPLPPR